MSDISTKKILLAVSKETVKGVPETLTSADFLEITADGASLTGASEKLETTGMRGSKLNKRSQKGIVSGEGSFALNMRAGENAGDAAEVDVLLQAAGFSKETVATKTALLAGSTTTVLNLASGDEAKYKLNQAILIDGKHIRHISGLDDGEISISPALASAPAAGLEIEKLTAYRLDDKTDVTFTLRKFFAGKVKQEIPGCKVSEISLSNATPGQIPQLSFSAMGINFFEVLENLGVSPDFSNAEYPATIKACLLKDGVAMDASEFSMTIAPNQVAKKTLCAENGTKEMHTTDYVISGSLTVFKKDDEVALQPGDSKFSLAISWHIPAGSNGEKAGICSMFFPACKIDEVDNNGEIEGLVSQSVNFSCEPDELDTNNVPVFTFI